MRKLLAAGMLLGFAMAAWAGPISFSGQFSPGLATVTTNGGDGWFDSSGAPVAVAVWGSDSGRDEQVLTLVTWTLTAPVSDLSFWWSYVTYDEGGPLWDPAGYYLNGAYNQLSNNGGPNSQSGVVSGLSLSTGDVFGFYVDSGDDILGRAGITITGVPEPGTFALFGLGLALAGAWRFRTRR